MQNTTVLAQIREAADNVLGTMFMSPLVDHAQPKVENWIDPIIVGLDFKGRTISGTCALVTEESTAKVLSATFLFEDGDLTRRSSWEVMCELANMLCGRFLGQLASEESCHLSSPRSMIPGDIGNMRPLHQSVLHIAHGELLFLVELEMDHHPAAAEAAR